MRLRHQGAAASYHDDRAASPGTDRDDVEPSNRSLRLPRPWQPIATIDVAVAEGDVVPDVRSVAAAIGHGMKAAQSIYKWLNGQTPETAEEPALAEFATLHTWYYTDARRVHRALLDTVRRQSSFEEMVQGLDFTHALHEARRCMSCGRGFSSDNCFSVCPENAVIKIDHPGPPRLKDLDYCIGCGRCVSECPSGAIQMVPEEI